jgi:predicted nucleic acid-binding protein
VIPVDTSVLVSFLKGGDTPGARYFERLVAEEAAFHLAPVVVQEVEAIQKVRPLRTLP